MRAKAISGILGAAILAACGGGSSSSPAPVASNPPPGSANPPEPAAKVTFSDRANVAGVQHSHGYSESFDAMPRFFAGGGAGGDVDGDGDVDIVITQGDLVGNLVLINDGSGSFTDASDRSGIRYPGGGTDNFKLSGPTLADMDGDGDLDLFMGGLGGDPSLLFQNNGSGAFTNVTVGSGLDVMTSENTISAAFGDYDRDGDLDMAMAHWGTPRNRLSPGETETLWRNDSSDGILKFTPVSQSSGISEALELALNGELGPDIDYSFAPNFADINDDGWPDLLVVSDFRGSQVFVNQTDGTFSDVTDRTQITDSNGMGAAIGDFDNDGDLDWFVSSINGNRLYENADGVMINAGSASSDVEVGGWGWGSCFADFDLDGNLDIYQTNGWYNDAAASEAEPFSADRTRLWMSKGTAGFEDLASEAGVDDTDQGRGVICADFDGDRDVDVLLLLNASERAARLWINETTSTNKIKIRLEGKPPNTHAIGARVFVTAGDQVQMREVKIGSNFISHDPSEPVFGVGDASLIDSVRIVWPDGAESTLSNINANQDLLFEHPDL